MNTKLSQRDLYLIEFCSTIAMDFFDVADKRLKEELLKLEPDEDSIELYQTTKLVARAIAESIICSPLREPTDNKETNV